MTPETESVIEKLVNLLNRADARTQTLENASNEQTDLIAELQDQKDVDVDYIQSLEAQIRTLIDQATEAQHRTNLRTIQLAWDARDNYTNYGWWEYMVNTDDRNNFRALADAMRCNEKINAIKYVRAVTGCSLKDGKNFVEGLFHKEDMD